MKKAKSVEAYIADAPEQYQGLLKDLRKAILEVVPEAEEKISYGMPYYGYKGRLVYFALARTHIGLYIPTPVIQDFERELRGYSTSKSATVRFPLDKKLPIPLIKMLVRARAKINEAKHK